jgi:8-oxo-dGTP pyrophosphatase MutT (NUDIX family)
MMNDAIRYLQKLRKFYWRIARPKTFGVRIIAITERGDVLLVKHRYSTGWYLPGGGVKRNEHHYVAAKRELREELKTDSIKNLTFVATYTNEIEFKKDTIFLFVCDVIWSGAFDKIELVAAQAFQPDALPDDISPATLRRIEEYKAQFWGNGGW